MVSQVKVFVSDRVSYQDNLVQVLIMHEDSLVEVSSAQLVKMFEMRCKFEGNIEGWGNLVLLAVTYVLDKLLRIQHNVKVIGIIPLVFHESIFDTVQPLLSILLGHCLFIVCWKSLEQLFSILRCFHPITNCLTVNFLQLGKFLIKSVDTASEFEHHSLRLFVFFELEKFEVRSLGKNKDDLLLAVEVNIPLFVSIEIANRHLFACFDHSSEGFVVGLWV